jgi:uncharacterized protein YdeI (YjbR/CyaY-like superfamily)
MPQVSKKYPSDYEIFYPTTPAAWRRWLEKKHITARAVWVVFYNKSSKKKSITWSQAVEVALCYGWIDSKKIKIDETSSHQFFSRRKPNSTWSKINKQKVEQLIAEGKMKQAGIDAIEVAKRNGSWELLDKVEELLIPDDLANAFAQCREAAIFYSTLSRSVRKAILQWLTLAKREETRKQRIVEVVTRAKQNLKPRHLQ